MDSAGVLRAARHQAGLTQRELARRAHTSHSTLAAYESGTKHPTVPTFERLLRAAGFGFDVQLVRVPSVDLSRRGEELREVLELADAFPTRPRGALRFPPFPARRS